MEVEFEIDSLAGTLIEKQSESHLNLCPKCKIQLQNGICPKCGEEVSRTKETYFDPDFEEYAKAVMEENEDFFKPQKWEDIRDEDLDKLEEEINAQSS